MQPAQPTLRIPRPHLLPLRLGALLWECPQEVGQSGTKTPANRGTASNEISMPSPSTARGTTAPALESMTSSAVAFRTVAGPTSRSSR
jgi:hypothetical protein